MSEYWKSTPKYWCKHCKTFVRDTKLEKANHEATGKHQGNIKRFLRDLHRGHEREEGDKDRAKNEIERLNGVVAGASPTTKGRASLSRPNVDSSTSQGREATPAERKAQLARLADLGVAVPEDYRREVAMAGDWQTVAERPIWNQIKKEEGLEDFKDFKPDPTLNVGVRKRKLEGQEDDQDTGTTIVKKGWGSSIRGYPGSAGDGGDDLEELLSKQRKPQQHENTLTEETESQRGFGNPLNPDDNHAGEGEREPPSVKRENSEAFDVGSVPNLDTISSTVVKQESQETEPSVVFKKRKAKISGPS